VTTLAAALTPGLRHGSATEKARDAPKISPRLSKSAIFARHLREAAEPRAPLRNRAVQSA